MTSHLTGHLSEEELERYRGRTLPPQRLLSVNAHLHGCDSCHERYGSESRLGEAFAFAQSFKATGVEESHLSFEQLAAYVDDALRGEEQLMVVAHLEECVECEAQVRELTPLRALIFGESYPAALLPAPAPAPVTQPKLFEKLRVVWQAPSFRLAAQVAGVVLVIAYWGGFWRAHSARTWPTFELKRRSRGKSERRLNRRRILVGST
jgi:anti-sigma factor RsiW